MKLKRSAYIVTATAFAVLCALECLSVFGPLPAVYAGIGLAVVCLTAYAIVKKLCRPDPEDGRLASPANRADLLFCGLGLLAVAAAMAPTVSDLISAIRQPNVTAFPYMYIRVGAVLAALAAGVLFLRAALTAGNPGRAAALIFAALFCFVSLVGESAYQMPLPDLGLYIPRMASLFFTGIFFCNCCMASASRQLKDLAAANAAALLSCATCLTDVFFWITKAPTAYLQMPPHSLVFAALAAVYTAAFLLTAGRRVCEAPQITEAPNQTEDTDEIQL